MRLATAGAAAALALAVALTAVPAQAQIQSSAKRSCIVAMNKAGNKLVKTIHRSIASCAKNVEGGGPEDIMACVAADPGSRIAKAQAKVTATEQKKCPVTPDFGYAPAAVVNASALATESALAENVLGPISPGGEEADGTGCRRAVVTDYTKLSDTLLGEFNRCVSTGLKTAGIDSPQDMAGCLMTISADTRGKIGKASVKLMLDFIGRCTVDQIDDLFPGFCGGAVGVLDFGTCVEQVVRCRACEFVNLAGDIDQDCDAFDNGMLDFSCPPGSVVPTTTTTSTTTTTVPQCGDGHQQAGEECDDGNTNNQDACTNSCTVATCGDHIRCSNAVCTTGPTGGIEECDGLASAACPGACLETCACAGNTLPPTTTTTTTSTTTTTTTTTVPDVVREFPTACIDATLNVPLLGGPQQIKSFGSATVRVELSTLGDADNDGKEDVSVEVIDMLFAASSDVGSVIVRLADPSRHPEQNQVSRGLIEENTDSTPDLDWGPYGGGGSASVQINAFVEAEITGQVNTVIHHDVPVDLRGTFANDPPDPGNLVSMVNPEPIIILNNFDQQFLGTTLDGVILDLNATTCE